MPKKKTQKKKIDGKYKIIGIAILVCLAEIFLALFSNGYLPFAVNNQTFSRYLTEKYNKDFTLVQSGLPSGGEFSLDKCSKFADQDGKEFKVYFRNDTHEIMDEYQAALFDDSIAAYISQKLDNKYFVQFSSTGSRGYRSKDEKYATALEYMKSLRLFDINIYTTQDLGEYFNDVNKLKDLTDQKFFVTVSQKTPDEYADIKNNLILSSNHQYYIIENHNITKKD